ncbi:hypothetical protein THAOC_19625 [Thalassiosira oceanica]|uniref:Uncharacterized protein n=1 Tax=Thalassiosira oceanica TaxID=159749 RepID=K0SNS9_THAOC|nr:hypothetical protein THAOC_19625 [Thalassiosira oceanica]|eukprot:EJK60087.1 hypothetical protein THAOC_19625 [Thalassiosira oceanica]
MWAKIPLPDTLPDKFHSRDCTHACFGPKFKTDSPPKTPEDRRSKHRRSSGAGGTGRRRGISARVPLPSSSTPRPPLRRATEPSTSRLTRTSRPAPGRTIADVSSANLPGTLRPGDPLDTFLVRLSARLTNALTQRNDALHRRAHPPPPEDVGDPPAAVVRPLRRGRAGERAQEAPAGRRRRGRRARGRRRGRRAGRQAPLRRGDVRLGGGRPAGEGASQGRESLSFTRSLVFYGHGSVTPEHEAAARHVEEARSLRKKYHGGLGVTSRLEGWRGSSSQCGGGGGSGTGAAAGREADGDKKPSAAEPAAGKDDGKSTATSPAPRLEYVFGTHGVAEVYDASDFRRTSNLVTVPSLPSFVSDYSRLVAVASSGAMRSFSFQRLQMLTSAYKMHVTVNGSAEDEAQSGLLGTDFYRTMKVDNHIHLAAAATARQFVDFVREKLEGEGDTVVMEDGTTLKEVFERAGLDSEHLTVDAFDVLADYSTYQRFDNFNRRRTCLAGWGARHILPVYTTLGRDVAVIKSAPRGALEPPRCALHPIRSGTPPWESNDVKSVRVPNSSAPLILPMKGGTGTRSSEWDEK